jgi:hypothetical protein
MASTMEAYQAYGIAEIMGHRQVAGLCREVRRFGAEGIEITVPDLPAVPEEWSAPEGAPNRYVVREAKPYVTAFVQWYAASSLFSFTPTTEAVAVAAARRFRVQPPRMGEPTPSSRLLGSAESDGVQDAEVVDDEPEDCDGGEWVVVPGR